MPLKIRIKIEIKVALELRTLLPYFYSRIASSNDLAFNKLDYLEEVYTVFFNYKRLYHPNSIAYPPVLFFFLK